MRRRTTCAICGSDRLNVFLDFPDMPLAGGFLTKGQLGTEQLYRLDVAYCEECSLVQVMTVVPAEELFSDYRYSSSTTTTLSSHFASYAQWIADLEPGLVVEFGCNDGVLLEPLARLGVASVGVEPAPNIAALARDRGVEVVNEFFNVDTATRIRQGNGAADVITGSNVFAHIDDIHEVMRGVDALLANDGRFVVEVHYLADIMSQLQFDSIYHEHIYYYSVHALKHLFGMYGLVPTMVTPISSHGGSIRVVAQRAAAAKIIHPSVERYLALEHYLGLIDAATYLGYTTAWDSALDRMRADLRGRDLCAYGAAGRAVMLLAMLDLDNVAYVVDESPLRAGRFVPKLHTPVVFPERFYSDPKDACLITAWTYRDEIVRKERYYQGEWITPLPRYSVEIHD